MDGRTGGRTDLQVEDHLLVTVRLDVVALVLLMHDVRHVRRVEVRQVEVRADVVRQVEVWQVEVPFNCNLHVRPGVQVRGA